MKRFALLAVGLACFASLAGSNAAPGLKEIPNDLKKLEGDWKIDSWTQQNQPIPMNAVWSFKGDKYTLDQGGVLEEGKITLDRTKKIPTMDLTITGGNCQGKDQPGIYKLDGDKLTLCFAWPGETDRPDEFVSKKENRWILITLTRKK